MPVSAKWALSSSLKLPPSLERRRTRRRTRLGAVKESLVGGVGSVGDGLVGDFLGENEWFDVELFEVAVEVFDEVVFSDDEVFGADAFGEAGEGEGGCRG